jgi:hypothetical protein
MGNDFMHYIVRGSVVQPIGQKIHATVRDNIADAEYAFALYNTRQRRYEFYYRTATDGDRPEHALYFDIDNASWLPQQFPYGVSVGVETSQSLLARSLVWDEVSETWDEVASTWDGMATPGTSGEVRDVYLVSSTGTTYRLQDAAGTDNGSVVTARWVSHGMSATEDTTRKTSVDQLWSEYKADETGMYILDTRGVQSDAWGSASTITYTIAQDGDQQFSALFATGDRPQFRITINDGKRPRIGRLSAGLRDAGQF